MSQDRRSIRTFRRHLALTAAIVTAGFTLSAALLLFVPLFAHLDGLEFDRDQLGGIATYFLHLHESFWPVVIGSMTASIASGMLLFDRMRSPLVRFMRVYEAVAEGRKPETLELRTRDYLHDEADALNGMVAALGARGEKAASELERISQSLSELACEDLSPKAEAALAEAREAAGVLTALVCGSG